MVMWMSLNTSTGHWTPLVCNLRRNCLLKFLIGIQFDGSFGNSLFLDYESEENLGNLLAVLL